MKDYKFLGEIKKKYLFFLRTGGILVLLAIIYLWHVLHHPEYTGNTAISIFHYSYLSVTSIILFIGMVYYVKYNKYKK